MFEVVKMQNNPIFSSISPCFMTVFSTDIDDEEEKNIQTIKYNHSTKLLPEKSSNWHMFIFPQTYKCLNAWFVFFIFKRSSYDEANGQS